MYFYVVYFVEVVYEFVCGDVDEVWCEVVLWYECVVGVVG